MADSYGQFTLWVSVYHLLKSEPSCTSHKPRASYQRWLVRGDLEHEIKFHVRDLLEPAIFDSLPWAYVMCNWAQILIGDRH